MTWLSIPTPPCVRNRIWNLSINSLLSPNAFSLVCKSPFYSGVIDIPLFTLGSTAAVLPWRTTTFWTHKQKKTTSQLTSNEKEGTCSPLFDGHVSGRHHVAQLLSLLGLKQARCVCAAVWVCVCGWRPTHTPGQSRCCPGCYHSGVRQLCEHEQTSTHRGERKSITGQQLHKCERGSHRGLDLKWHYSSA